MRHQTIAYGLRDLAIATVGGVRPVSARGPRLVTQWKPGRIAETLLCCAINRGEEAVDLFRDCLMRETDACRMIHLHWCVRCAPLI